MFTHTEPAFSARAIRCARAPSRVHTAAARPKRVSFATRTASSASATLITATAGPKISSRLIRMSFVVATKIEGWTKNPSGAASTVAAPPPIRARAPSSSADPYSSSTRSRCRADTIGPICASGSSGGPSRIRSTRSARRSTGGPATPSCAISRPPAVQTWPALRNVARSAPSSAASRSASSSTTFADLPPSSSVSRFRFPAAARWISRPTSVEPVKETLSTSSCSASAAPASASPVTTFQTPSGTPASSPSSASRSARAPARLRSGALAWPAWSSYGRRRRQLTLRRLGLALERRDAGPRREPHEDAEAHPGQHDVRRPPVDPGLAVELRHLGDPDDDHRQQRRDHDVDHRSAEAARVERAGEADERVHGQDPGRADLQQPAEERDRVVQGLPLPGQSADEDGRGDQRERRDRHVGAAEARMRAAEHPGQVAVVPPRERRPRREVRRPERRREGRDREQQEQHLAEPERRVLHREADHGAARLLRPHRAGLVEAVAGDDGQRRDDVEEDSERDRAQHRLRHLALRRVRLLGQEDGGLEAGEPGHRDPDAEGEEAEPEPLAVPGSERAPGPAVGAALGEDDQVEDQQHRHADRGQREQDPGRDLDPEPRDREDDRGEEERPSPPGVPEEGVVRRHEAEEVLQQEPRRDQQARDEDDPDGEQDPAGEEADVAAEARADDRVRAPGARD